MVQSFAASVLLRNLERPRPRPLFVPIALGVGVGIAVQLASPPTFPSPLPIIAFGITLWWAWWHGADSRSRMASILAASACIGGLRAHLDLQTLPANHLSLLRAPDAPDHRRLVDVTGIVSRSSRTLEAPSDSWSREPRTVFTLSVVRVNGVEVGGVIHVSAAGVLETPLFTGDRITTCGWLRTIAAPRNPGARDPRLRFRQGGVAGRLTVPAVASLTRVEPVDADPMTRIRARLKWRAHELMDPESNSVANALLRALLLGIASDELSDTRDAVHSLGLAHLLAISGLHLGIVAAGLLFILRMISGGTRRWHGVCLIVITIAYVAMLDVRIPVLRASIMAVLHGLGMLGDRRFCGFGLLSATATIVLLTWPSQLLELGFQLSFGVVLALMLGMREIHQRWFGLTDRSGPSIRILFLQRIRSALTVSCVAWMAALPIILFRFGTIAWAGIPLTLLTMPIITTLVAVGALRIAIGFMHDGTGVVIHDVILLPLAKLFVFIVESLGAQDWTTITLRRFPPTWWVVIAMIWIWFWLRPRPVDERWRPRAMAACGWLLVASLLILQVTSHGANRLELHMLDVGDGTCFILRSDDEVILVDGGSTGGASVGDRIIVPALRALDIHRVDRIVVTHANTDHFNGIAAVLDSVEVNCVMVAPQFFTRPLPAATEFLFAVRAHGCVIETLSAGDRFACGRIELACVHPEASDQFVATNDESIVLLGEVAVDDPDRPHRRILLTGDVQGEGVRLLRQRFAVPDVIDVLELPHHGSTDGAAMDWVESLSPRIVLQSTGPGRIAAPEWDDILVASDRFITARDGACLVVIDSNGSIRTERTIE